MITFILPAKVLKFPSNTDLITTKSRVVQYYGLTTRKLDKSFSIVKWGENVNELLTPT